MNRFLAMILSLFVASAATAQTAPPPETATVVQPVRGEQEYVLGVGDLIEVEVLGQADFGRPRVRVRADGSVPLPVVGDVPAANVSVVDFARTVERRLIDQQFYTAPSVNVNVVGYASRYVIVLGAVAQPGLIPIDRDYRVSEVLARAGGAREGSEYVILSSRNGRETKIAIDDVARNLAADPYVQADDKLFVPPAEMFYIYGQVNAPGTYAIREGMTIRQAIARGGGLTPSGSEKKLTVYRKEQKLKLSLDTQLQPGDVIVLGERLF